MYRFEQSAPTFERVKASCAWSTPSHKTWQTVTNSPATFCNNQDRPPAGATTESAFNAPDRERARPRVPPQDLQSLQCVTLHEYGDVGGQKLQRREVRTPQDAAHSSASLLCAPNVLTAGCVCRPPQRGHNTAMPHLPLLVSAGVRPCAPPVAAPPPRGPLQGPLSSPLRSGSPPLAPASAHTRPAAGWAGQRRCA